jgi:hypothetical protein
MRTNGVAAIASNFFCFAPTKCPMNSHHVARKKALPTECPESLPTGCRFEGFIPFGTRSARGPGDQRCKKRIQIRILSYWPSSELIIALWNRISIRWQNFNLQKAELSARRQIFLSNLSQKFSPSTRRC